MPCGSTGDPGAGDPGAGDPGAGDPDAMEKAEQILCQLRDAPQPPCIMLLQSGCVHEPMCFMIYAAAEHKA